METKGNEAPAPTKSVAGTQTVPLSDGRTATVRKAKGRDIRKGSAMTGGSTDVMSIMVGVAASATSIDGKPVTFEEFDELDVVDVFALMGAAIGGNALSQVLGN